MASILLLDGAVAYGAALANQLRLLGHTVTRVSSAEELVRRAFADFEGGVVLVADAGDVSAGARAELASFRLVLIDAARLGRHRRESIEATAENLALELARARPAAAGGASPLDTELASVLGGLVHGIRNPLTAATGWLQLLEMDLPESDPRRKALANSMAELHRLERILGALSVIAGKPCAGVAFDLVAAVRDRAREIEREGLKVCLDLPATPLPRIQGDPAGWALALELVLGSFLPERRRARELGIGFAATGPLVELRIADTGGTLQGVPDVSSLGAMLERMRYGRALGIALLRKLLAGACDQPVGFEDAPGAGGATLVVRAPAVPEGPRPGGA